MSSPPFHHSPLRRGIRRRSRQDEAARGPLHQWAAAADEQAPRLAVPSGDSPSPDGTAMYPHRTNCSAYVPLPPTFTTCRTPTRGRSEPITADMPSASYSTLMTAGGNRRPAQR
ncbi:hypothetical protein JOF41_002218 [Saccharothrix coeruleofusca]|uniref:hypothetical protein n=1 Tax=Saccharothrix coeruleofusca TaxID=33919 RepID=UPI001AEAAEBA|nr:hypothetical protein [Saccharothrix coeruleofusca]MBP2336040.1 hypothetical protein [Saccharothrix coeruleofusca]